MITGVKEWSGAGPQPASGRSWIAALIAGLAALAVLSSRAIGYRFNIRPVRPRVHPWTDSGAYLVRNWL